MFSAIFGRFLQSVTLHTNLGDIKCEIFCDEVPKTAEVSFRIRLQRFCDLSVCLFLENFVHFLARNSSGTGFLDSWINSFIFEWSNFCGFKKKKCLESLIWEKALFLWGIIEKSSFIIRGNTLILKHLWAYAQLSIQLVIWKMQC